MEELVLVYNTLQAQLWSLYKVIAVMEDGFKYKTSTNSYGSSRLETHSNSFTVKELCKRYNGDNGNVIVYTTNRNHGIIERDGVSVSVIKEESWA